MQNNNGLVAGVVAIVLGTMLCATLVFIFAPDGNDLAPLIGLAGTTVTALVTLAKVSAVADKVEQVDKRTEDLSNGLMDAKIVAGVADVIRPEHIDPKASEQIDAARQRREQSGH